MRYMEEELPVGKQNRKRLFNLRLLFTVFGVLFFLYVLAAAVMWASAAVRMLGLGGL